MLITLKKIGWFFREYRKTYGIGIATLMLTNVTAVLFPWLLGGSVDHILGGSLSNQVLMQDLFFLCALLVSNYGLNYLWGYLIFKNAILMQKELVSMMMKKFLGMKAPFFEKYNTGDLMARATSDVKEIQELVGFGILAFSDGLGFSIAILLSMIFLVSWKLTLVSILPFPLMAFAMQSLGKYLHERFNAYQVAFAKMNDQTLEYISGVRVVRAYVMENRSIQKFREYISDVAKKLLRSNVISTGFMPIANLFMTISMALAVGYGTILISQGEITLGGLISFNFYLNYLGWPMFALGEFVNIAQRGGSSIERVYEVLREKNEADSYEKVHLSEPLTQIDFQNYSFTYPSASVRSLNEINLTLHGGKTLGIVGKTGSGKSTLVKQLLKEYAIGEGELSINHIRIENIQEQSLMKKIGYVSQENILFSRSIRDNIFFGAENPSEEQLQHSIRMADFEKDIFSLPKGLDTMVGERGVAVSGGQKQRISIARALMREPELLILDDALSAVDAKTEHRIIENIRKTRQGKTNLIVTHRLSAVEHADHIIVLDNGRIIEEGTHQGLVEKGGWYMEQYNIQRLEDQDDESIE